MESKTVLRQLKEWCDITPPQTRHACLDVKINELLEIEKQQPGQFNPKWIAVNDGLPKENKKIIFKLKGNDVRMGMFLLKDEWGRPNVFCDGAFHEVGSVKEWFYLPD